MRNLYAGQETTVRTGHGTADWFQKEKGVCQGCILPPCLFNFYAEYIMKNAGLEEAKAGIKIARRNIDNLRYTDDTTLMAESEEELKSLLMKVKEKSGKVGLKHNIHKTKIMASGPITSWDIDGETVETVSDFSFLVSKITADGDCSNEIKRRLLLGRKVLTNLESLLKSTFDSCQRIGYFPRFGGTGKLIWQYSFCPWISQSSSIHPLGYQVYYFNLISIFLVFLVMKNNTLTTSKFERVSSWIKK